MVVASVRGGKITLTGHGILTAALVFAFVTLSQKAVGQSVSPTTAQPSPQVQGPPPQPTLSVSRSLSSGNQVLSPSSVTPPLFDFKDSDIKFQLASLMNILRDSRHESWVLAAYPDPKTSRPLIGAGFSLDVTATEHTQRDPLNPHPFLEPSSVQLWQAAGLDPDKLQNILDQYDRDLDAWKKKNFRRKIRTHELSPQLTDEEATKLLRISAIQATYNARAYCRMFDQLTASQQMALSQLVFQMGVNLEEFTQFLSTVNDDVGYRDSAEPGNSAAWQAEHWKTVQSTLIQSQWARRYTSRAVSVIAMFDPDYAQNPQEAERKVLAQIRPKATHHRKKTRVRSAKADGADAHAAKTTGQKT
jgi:hypothetical protein